MSAESPKLTGPTLERKIGATTYRVTGVFSENATETAASKMRRLIFRDAEKLGTGGSHRRL